MKNEGKMHCFLNLIPQWRLISETVVPYALKFIF